MIINYLLLFTVFVIFAAYPIGRSVFQGAGFKEDSLVSNFFLSVTLGMLLITIEGFLFGKLGLWKIMPFLILSQSILSLCYLRRDFYYGRLKFNFFIPFLIVVVVAINAVITIPFGVINGNNLMLGGVHGTDSNWHLSLINSIEKDFPPQNPLYSGIKLTNYHYLVDLQIAIIKVITHIPTDVLFYQLIGPFYILLYVVLAYLVGKKLTKTVFGGVVTLLLTTLSSNWYYLANYFYPTSYKWPSVAWVDYFSSKSVNYPLLFSIVVFFWLIYIFLVTQKFNLKKVILLSIVIGSLISIKSHTSIVLFASLFSLGGLEMFKKKFQLLTIAILATAIALFFMLSTFSPSQQVLILSPFWFIKTMYEAPDRLNFDIWELKRQYLLSVGSYKGVLKLYTEGFLLFIGVNLNFLVLGFIVLKKKLDYLNKRVVVLLCLISFFSVVFTMLLIYKGDAIITIQFFYTAIVSLSLLCAIIFSGLYKWNRFFGTVAFIILWSSLLPGVVYTVKAYLPNSSYMISQKIVEGMNFLRTKKYGVVIVDTGFAQNSMISAYTEKPVYYSDEIILSSLSVNFETRKKDVDNFFQCKDKNTMSKLIQINNIKYVFSSEGSKCLEKIDFLQKQFSNSEVTIYSVVPSN